jgi:hypothetical protein
MIGNFAHTITISCFTLGLSCCLYAQPVPAPLFTSPEIRSDNTVTFRCLSKSAREVKLSTQIENSPIAMTKDSLGIWSVTIGPVKPDIYPYHYILDGTSVADPRNSAIFPNEGFQSSLVEITGPSPLVHTLQNVPHGAVSYRYYNSPELGTRPVVIYSAEL